MYRDGVSEGQFAQVMTSESGLFPGSVIMLSIFTRSYILTEAFTALDPTYKPKLTYSAGTTCQWSGPLIRLQSSVERGTTSRFFPTETPAPNAKAVY